MLYNRFKNLETLYTSSTTKVMRATDELTKESVVLKTVASDQITQEMVERLRHEYAILQQINSPYVAKTLMEFEEEGTYYIVEEYQSGSTLCHFLKQEPLTISQFYNIAIQLVSGLSDIHEAGIIHKDLNPSNIMYDLQTNHVTILDFGIASLFTHERTVETKVDKIEGTLHYIAPEQTGRMNMNIDHRADFYALGIIFYEMLVGHCPFQADTPIELIYCHIAKTPPSIQSRKPHLPPMLAQIIEKLLSKMAKDRYFSCEGLLYDLKRSKNEHDFILGSKDYNRRFEFLDALYGREKEILQLKHEYKEVTYGAKSLVSIYGPSGIGKTALVQVLQEQMLLSNGMFLQGKFDQYHADAPYYSFFEIIRQFCHLVTLQTRDEQKQWIDYLLQNMGSDVAILTQKVAELADLLVVEPHMIKLTPIEERTRFKLALGKFISLLPTSQRPLVIFLDDVHLADMGSLEMLEEIFSNDEVHHLMVIISYRDNEPHTLYHIIHSLNKIEQMGQVISRLPLTELSNECIARMLEDLFKISFDQAIVLARIINKKTKGNPFYIKQFLRYCHMKHIIFFDKKLGNWYYDLDKILHSPAQENVVDFLVEHMDHFSKETVLLLSYGACIGCDFSKHDLSSICGLTKREIDERLMIAVEQEALYPIEKGISHGHDTRFRFTHDRFQQVFYMLLSQDQRTEIHYRIGQYYENVMDHAKDSDERLFDIANHYAKGIYAVDDIREKTHIMHVLLKAAKRCSRISAFDIAERYLSVILSHPEIENEDMLALRLNVYMELHTALCNLVKEECDQIYQKLCELVEQPVDLVDNCCLQISTLSNRGRYKDAFMLGIDLLMKFGVTFPQNHFSDALQQEITYFYQKRSTLLKDHQLNIYPSNDLKEAKIAKLICRICAPAFFFRSDYAYWTVFVSVRRIFHHGYTPHSLQMYSNCILPLSDMNQDYRTSYEAARTAMKLAEKHQYRDVIYCIYCMFSLHSCHWFEDITSSIPYAREAIKGNTLAGDFEYACYGYYGLIMAVLESANDIQDVWNELEPAIFFAKKTGNHHALETFLSFQQFCRSIHGDLSLDGCFDGDDFTEHKHIDTYAHNLQAISYYYILRALSAVIYQDYQSAYSLCRYVIPILSYVSGFYNIALHNFLYSLSICRLLDSYGRDKQASCEELLVKLRENQAWLKKRSQDAACNYEHLYFLIEAEQTALHGNIKEALPLYEKALALADTHGRPLHLAIIVDVIAQRYKALGITSAYRHYLRYSYRLFLKWGAQGKCLRMEREHAELSEYGKEACYPQTITANEKVFSTSSLDMISVLKASQAISEELELEGILEKLIHSLLECSGAQNIFYLSKTRKVLEIWAEGHVDAENVCSITKRIADGMDLPLSIITYVVKTLETVLLNDAENAKLYQEDMYIKNNHCKSILCMPILSKGQLKGILYLENNLATGVFDQRRKDHLTPIAAQLAISMDNAYLYEHLRYLVDEKTQALQEEVKVRQRAEEKLAHMANYDALTGLPNRRMFHDILTATLLEAQHTERQFAILYMDLDGFKEVNDTYGHEKGDLVLTESARRLHQVIFDDDTVVRVGGDEFVILLSWIRDEGEVKRICERIHDEMLQPIMIEDDIYVQISISIGISIFPKDGKTEKELLFKADRAMYREKKGQKRTINK